MSADLWFQVRRDQLVALEARYKVPVMYEWPEFVAAGGLISYSTVLSDSMLQMGIYAGRILNGAKPADLPIVQSTRFELVPLHRGFDELIMAGAQPRQRFGID